MKEMPWRSSRTIHGDEVSVIPGRASSREPGIQSSVPGVWIPGLRPGGRIPEMTDDFAQSIPISTAMRMRSEWFLAPSFCFSSDVVFATVL